MTPVRLESRRKDLDGVRWLEWSKAFPPEAFAERNRRLYAHPYGVRIQTWGFALGGAIPASLDLLPPHLECGETSLDSFLVANVVVAKEHRGRGLATALLQGVFDLHPGRGWLLYSDIGFPFYERFGFRGTLHSEITAPLGHGVWREPEGTGAIPRPSALWPSWRLERYRWANEVWGTPLVPFEGHCDRGHRLVLAPEGGVDRVDILWWHGGCEACRGRAESLGKDWGLHQWRYWVGGAVPGGEPQYPMVHVPGGLAPSPALQLGDWW